LRAPTVVLLVLAIAGSVVAHRIATDDIDATEQRLLEERTDLLEGPLQGLGTQYGGRTVAAAAVAKATDGQGFAEFVTGDASADADSLQWSLFILDGTTPRLVEALGSPPLLTDSLDDEVRALLEQALTNPEFVVLGLFGTEGLDRRIALGAVQPTLAGAYLAYVEIPLISAVTSEETATASDPEATASDPEATASDPEGGEQQDGDQDFGGFENLALAMYLGSEPNEEDLIFSFGDELPFRGRTASTVIDVGAQQILLVTKATKPLADDTTRALPWILFGGILLVGVVLAALVEVSLRRRSARARYEAELRQSQRLEAVGRLAGGVAHDFNNLLAAILSYGDLLSEELGPDHPAQSEVDEVRAAARRGADLVRQLLAFSRREPAHHEAMQLDDVVRGVESLLRRLVGEAVELETRLDPAAPVINADRGQLEQVLVNLVVNARDALDGGGTITVEVDAVELDRAYARSNPDASSGPHARLRVTDTGTGMEAEVRARAFEPFFTTKEPGQGTGLGLSTVYGIVTRSGGHVTIDSVRGAGTAVSVFLPAVRASRGRAARDESLSATEGAER
jgi:signal transduction histidine kinase